MLLLKHFKQTSAHKTAVFLNEPGDVKALGFAVALSLSKINCAAFLILHLQGDNLTDFFFIPLFTSGNWPLLGIIKMP